MTASEVNLISHLNWTLFWAIVIAFVIGKELLFRRKGSEQPAQPEQQPRVGSVGKQLLTTIAPALLLALLVLVPMQSVVATIAPPHRLVATTSGEQTDNSGAAASPDDLVTQGEMIIRTKGCLGCHTIAGVSEIGTIGPELTHIASQEQIADSIPYSPENLREWLLHPHELKPGTQMPDMNLTPEDLDAVVAYLDTLK
jgi:cytochrome c2